MIARLVPVAALILWVNHASAAEPGRTPPHAPTPASPVEQAYSERADAPLSLVGHSMLAGAAGLVRSAPQGSARGDHPLGAGDTLLVTLRGQTASSKRYAVDAEGRLLIDELGPILAAGRSLDELRAELSAAVAATHPNTEVFVSLTEIRRIGVLVVGAVARPGPLELAGASTLLDALTAAGGVARDGALRRIHLVRNGAPRIIDLYPLLMTGVGAGEDRLQDGDRIMVPPLGPTLAVAGQVMRPGIYELAAGRERLSLREVRDLAGGTVRAGAHRALRLSIAPSGAETAEEVADPDEPLFGHGDLLLLTPLTEDRRNIVHLDGHAHRPGPRALPKVRSLAGLVAEGALKPDAYRAFAALDTADRATGARALHPVDLGAVLGKREDRPLADGDTLLVLGPAEVDFLTSESVLSLLRGGAPPAAGCRGLGILASTLAADPGGPLARGPQARLAAGLVGGDTPCPPLYDAHPDLLAFALQHSVLMQSGVPRPGFYPVAGRTPVSAERHRQPARGGIVGPTESRYELLGHVRHPGVRPLVGAATLRGALGADDMLPGVYPLMGVIERFDRHTLTRVLLPFSPQDVVAGRADRALADKDRIRLFPERLVRDLALPGAPPAAAAAEEDPVDPETLALLAERAVQVRGAVRLPGAYPVAESAPLEALIAVAGGLTAGADSTSVEVTAGSGAARRSTLDFSRPEARRTPVRTGDAVRVNPAFTTLEARAVTIEGAVRRPGSYDVLRGETLSSLIARAGGLTEEAYPAGTVFTRESARREEKADLERQARELDAAILLEQRKGEPIREREIAQARQLAVQIRSLAPIGRIVVESDPAVLRTRPELDVLLEADDRIHIPKRSLTVAVRGEVLSQATLQFVSGKSAEDYLQEAGGPTRDADEGRIYLLLPDGRAQPLSLSSWNHAPSAVPPGSTLVVPRDPQPFEFLDLGKTIVNIIGQIALTAASIAVIGR